MMPSQKRNKGKVRKAESAARATAQVEADILALGDRGTCEREGRGHSM